MQHFQFEELLFYWGVEIRQDDDQHGPEYAVRVVRHKEENPVLYEGILEIREDN